MLLAVTLYWYTSRFYILREHISNPPGYCCERKKENMEPMLPDMSKQRHEYAVSLFVPFLCYIVYHFAI